MIVVFLKNKNELDVMSWIEIWDVTLSEYKPHNDMINYILYLNNKTFYMKELHIFR